jgi:NAD+ synthetase
MKIALAQINPTIGDLAGNAGKILAIAHTLTDQGVTLMVTPELSLCGYPPRDLLMEAAFIDELAIALQTLAQKLPPNLGVLVGTVERNHHAAADGEKPLYNSAAYLWGGAVQQIFHKQLLPTYDVFDEDRYFAPGKEANILTLTVSGHPLRLGITICEDIWNDEHFWGQRSYAANPVATLAAQSVDLLINLSASPFALGKHQLRQKMLQHHVQTHGHPLVYVNQVGANDDLIFDGRSMVWNRSGSLLSVASMTTPDTLLVTYDTEHRDVTALPQNPAVALPDCAEAEIWSALVLGVADYARKCGFHQAILGLSGGIDSALVAAIATAALGSDHVLAVLMPSPYSSTHSVTDALALAQNLGIATQTIPIAPMMAAFEQSLAPIFGDRPADTTEENLQSRIRGSLLMALSNKFGYLLLSTGNKSELSVGYCTLYGDMNGGLSVIADVPKTMVYRLCQWLNRDRPLIPPSILTKPPSAELRPGQVDQDSLPDYDTLDQLLEHHIHRHASRTELLAQGFEPATVDRVLRLVKIAEFKRRQAPPGLKITERAFGSGWRMPIALDRKPLLP